MSSPVDLHITAGRPYRRRIRVVDGTTIWPTAEPDVVEVRSQIRHGRTPTSALLADLGQHLEVTVDGADLVVELALTGADTYALAGKGGYYDIVLSDPGTVDERLVRIVHGQVLVGQMTTSPAGTGE